MADGTTQREIRLEQGRRYREKHRDNPEWQERQRAHKRRYRDKYREELRAKGRERQRKRRADNPTLGAEEARAYRERNPGASAQISRRWREAHPDHREKTLEAARARARRWAANHPEYSREQNRRRRARIRGAVGYASTDAERGRWDVRGRACIYCGTSLPWEDRANWHFDHLIPLSRGGTNWPANLAPACFTCNVRKGKRTYFEYIALQELVGS